MSCWHCGSMLVCYTRGRRFECSFFAKIFFKFYSFCRFYRIHSGKPLMYLDTCSIRRTTFCNNTSCFGLLMMSALDFKVRVDTLVAGFSARTDLTFACKTETLGSLHSHALLIPLRSSKSSQVIYLSRKEH